ncbi:tyrosine-type recombinase/integrase [Marinospirillum sp. MEB164]|uniref:Tyrosine-type recombinase/integrase n=1 Tax=Marinospirillum alkalitolerans TaxID=3123374 RepID=A0ABW8PX12_9GAMM
MSIHKTKTGWQARVYITPTIRPKKTFKTQAEAKRWMAQIKHRYDSGHRPEQKDTRTLLDLINQYNELHLSHLSSGADRYSKLVHLCNFARNPKAKDLDALWYTHLRNQRAKHVSPNTLNHDRAYLSSMFNVLIRLGLWHQPNPVKTVASVKTHDAEVIFLAHDQIDLLLCELSNSQNPHVRLIAEICLSTGARWSEAEKLQSHQVTPGLISFWKTKSKRSRHVPISDELFQKIKQHKKHSVNRLFGPSYAAFTSALKRSGIQLPQGQRTHVLRHTFASHFVMNGGNLIELKEILGHSTITMTMRYAHLAPGRLDSATKLNPLANTYQNTI